MSDSSPWRLTPLSLRKMSRSRSDKGVRAGTPPPGSDILRTPPSPGNPPIVLSPDDNATETPPKKKWEQHYKKFLTKRILGSPRSNDEARSSSGEDDSGKSGRGSRRILRKKSDLLPPLSSMPPMPDLSTQKSNEDVAVRGGNFFQSLFSREHSSSTDNSHDHNHNLPPQPPLRRRIKSMDTLDSTLRRGVDKALSPSNTRVRKEMQLDGPLELDEPPVHGGVAALPPSRQHIPAALSSSKHSREMKKAFTEFHNSSKFSVDASSPFLGDDPSTRSRPSDYLAMPKRTTAGGTTVFVVCSWTVYDFVHVACCVYICIL